MAKYLDWYLVELEKNLDHRMSAEAVFELLNQTEDHIEMIKQELMVSGMDEIRAEQAAIQRFGDLDALAPSQKLQPVVRANWAAPVLILVGGTAVVGASMVVGSVDSMMASGCLGIASLVVSALLCCRKGRFPGLAFGLLLAVCFASLSVIASIEFYGPRLDLVKRTDRKRFLDGMQEARKETLRFEAERHHIVHLGQLWAAGKLGHEIPPELRSPNGILCPLKSQWGGGFGVIGFAAFNKDLENARRLFGGSGPYYLSAESVNLEPLRHQKDAITRWKMYSAQGEQSYQNSLALTRYNDAIDTLNRGENYDTDNLFAGLCFGSALTAIWMLIAFLMNRLASADWSGERRLERSRPRVARS